MNCSTFGHFNKNERGFHLLGGDLALQSAPERLFGISYAIYRNVNPEFDEFLDYGADLEGLNYCFWVLRDGQRIGGIIIRPNHIEGMFLLPPHTDTYRVLQRVLPLLRSWSDLGKPIEATNVMDHELDAYRRLGFRPARGSRFYIRPTEPLEVRWEPDWEVLAPEPAHVDDLAVMFHTAYADYPPEFDLGHYSLDEWRCRAAKRVTAANQANVCRTASTLVYDRVGHQLVGACLIGTSRSIVRPEVPYAKVLDIAVDPGHRRRSLGARMLRRALSALFGHFPVLKFAVAVGNAAEAFYCDQGFLPGPAEHWLRLASDAQKGGVL